MLYFCAVVIVYYMPKRSVLLDYHLRNLSLKHVAKAWSMIYRGYSLADYEYYSNHSPYWVGYEDMDFKHIPKPKPSLRLYN